MAEQRDDTIVVYVDGIVDGHEVTRETVDSRAALELAVTYVEMMGQLAEERDQTLDLHGLEIVPGSVGFQMHSRTPKEVRLAVRQVDRIFAGRAEPATQKSERASARLVRAVEMLPEGCSAKVEIGKFSRSLQVVRAPVVEAELWSSTTLRAVPFKVGGARTPKVWFRSLSEDGPLGVTTDIHTAQEVAHHLYGEVEVTFRFVRDEEDGGIESAFLESFEPVRDMAADEEVRQWREWFGEAGAHWKDVDDVDAELGSGGKLQSSQLSAKPVSAFKGPPERSDHSPKRIPVATHDRHCRRASTNRCVVENAAE